MVRMKNPSILLTQSCAKLVIAHAGCSAPEDLCVLARDLARSGRIAISPRRNIVRGRDVREKFGG